MDTERVALEMDGEDDEAHQRGHGVGRGSGLPPLDLHMFEEICPLAIRTLL